MELSVIIPSRNEIFLQKTIENILENIEADTEVIAICDGYLPSPPLNDNPRVRVIYHNESIGQRAATNEGARVSDAKYIMKIDAHCAVGKGFDRILMADCQPDWTMIPMMWNLHAFDWKCTICGERTYQGVRPEKCEKCGASGFEMVIVWQPRGNKVTISWRFDNTMHFQYWRKHSKRKEAKGDLIETMSCIGACFLMRRDRFWDLDGMDEAHGSWGQFGTELACKTWLSGGKMITSKKTWFGHMFRTGNFKGAFETGTFPYWISGDAQEYAKQYSRDLWLNNKWPKQTRPLSWLVDHFKPVPDWHEKDTDATERAV
jgi:glycosyltransferase involved in cell wall biosynthesis